MAYHINDSGEPGKCSATMGNCPFGGEHQHYATKEKAQAAYELSMGAETFKALQKNEPEEKMPYPFGAIKSELREKLKKNMEIMTAPIFDEFDAEVGHRARERYNYYSAQESMYETLEQVKLTANSEEELVEASLSSIELKPANMSKKSDAYQAWQGRANVLSDFLAHEAPNNREAQLFIKNNDAAVEWHYK